MPKLLGSKTSPFVRKVRVALLEKDMPFELVDVSPWTDESAITTHNPLGRVPVYLDDNDDAWFESSLVIQLPDSHPSGVGGTVSDACKLRESHRGTQELR